MAKTKIVDRSFNSHNKISYIKNFMYIYILTEICQTINYFQSSFHKLFPAHPDSFCLCVYPLMNFIQ